MTKVETNIFDKVERHFNCAVEILTNSTTGETSIGWVSMESATAKEWQAEETE